MAEEADVVSRPIDAPALLLYRCHGRRPPDGALAGCLDEGMTTGQETSRVVSASREMAAGPARIFELIADPAQQPRWDGNDNLAEAAAGQRVRRG